MRKERFPLQCIFCEIARDRAPSSRVLEDEQFIALLDIYPMRPGHTLIIPRRHAVLLAELAAGELAALFTHAARLGTALRRGVPCDDVNLIVNDGRAANQSVPHVHVHLIPRRRGDLARLLGKLVQRPVQPLLGGPPRATLDRQAAEIRAAL